MTAPNPAIVPSINNALGAPPVPPVTGPQVAGLTPFTVPDNNTNPDDPLVTDGDGVVMPLSQLRAAFPGANPTDITPDTAKSYAPCATTQQGCPNAPTSGSNNNNNTPTDGGSNPNPNSDGTGTGSFQLNNQAPQQAVNGQQP